MMNSPLVKQRVVAALRGAFIGDASSMGTHWIYDPAEMAKAVTSLTEPEFREPAKPSFYSAEEFPGHYESGMLSPYGEQLLFVTEYVASTDEKTFGGESMSESMLQWATTFGGRPDGATKAFIKNMNKEDKSGKWLNCGADDHEAHIYMKIVPVVARYAGSPDLVDKLTQAIRVHQNNDVAVAFGVTAGRLLEAIILGAPLEEALETVQRNVDQDLVSQEVKDDVLKAFGRGKRAGKDESHKTLDEVLLEVSHEVMGEDKKDSPFYNLAARSCALPGSFIAPIAIFYKYLSTASTAFSPALRENILASGDTCSRAVFIGAILGAAGVGSDDDAKWQDSIPSDWNAKLNPELNSKLDAALLKIVVGSSSIGKNVYYI